GSVDNADIQAMLHLLIAPSGGDSAPPAMPPGAPSLLAADTNRQVIQSSDITITILQPTPASLSEETKKHVAIHSETKTTTIENAIARPEVLAQNASMSEAKALFVTERGMGNLAETDAASKSTHLATDIDRAIGNWQRHRIRNKVQPFVDQALWIDHALE